MAYQTASGIDIFESGNLRDIYELNGNLTSNQHSIIAHVASAELPPSAVNAAAVRENCQHWCIRVLQKLVAYDIVTEQKIKGLPRTSLVG